MHTGDDDIDRGADNDDIAHLDFDVADPDHVAEFDNFIVQLLNHAADVEYDGWSAAEHAAFDRWDAAHTSSDRQPRHAPPGCVGPGPAGERCRHPRPQAPRRNGLT